MQAKAMNARTSEIIDAEFVDRTLNAICESCLNENKSTFCEGYSEHQCAINALANALTAKPKTKTPKIKRPKQPKLTREQKAQKMFDDGVRPVKLSRDRWTVKGSADNEYEVTNNHDFWTCSCLDFLSRGLVCKHALLVRTCQQTQEAIGENEIDPHDIHLKTPTIIIC